MNEQLERLAVEIHLNHPDHENLRLTFAYACADRVRHLLEEPDVIGCLDTLGEYLKGEIDDVALGCAANKAASLANHHQGSMSIDGCGHAAVSASYAVANALKGKALQSASYAAYALVYASGGYAALAERDSFRSEFNWQSDTLKVLAGDSLLACCSGRFGSAKNSSDV